MFTLLLLFNNPRNKHSQNLTKFKPKSHFKPLSHNPWQWKPISGVPNVFCVLLYKLRRLQRNVVMGG